MRPCGLALLLAGLLAACARPAPPPPSFRDLGVPIASSLRAEPADLVGAWVVSAAYPGWPFGDLSLGRSLRIAASAERTLLTLDSPRGAAAAITLEPAGAGRFRLSDGTELWLLWTDDDVRTAVVGTPDGTFGWIMDRPGAASPDRLAAAREVLDFNGYDVARLLPAS